MTRIVAIAYERKYGQYSRLHSMAKVHLWTADSATIGCPLAMTDGAARVIELLGTQSMKDRELAGLTSRYPDQFLTAGQWMTERAGGSDITLTETIATALEPDKTGQPGDWYSLDGFKWFSSATDGDLVLTLARTNLDKSIGTRGLSLFLAHVRNEGQLNGIRVHRLKNKFGTQPLPTAELELNGMKARLVGGLGEGVKEISSVLNITRLWCAVSVTGSLSRALAIARSYARVRQVQGKELVKHSLHVASLSRIAVVYRALLQLTFETAALVGKDEASVASKEDQLLLRLLTPVSKAYTAVHGTREIANCMDALGGAGYMEENEIGGLLRDATVNRIWEGTEQVLALDVARVVNKSRGQALSLFIDWVSRRLAHVGQWPESVESALKSGLDCLKRLQPQMGPRISISVLHLIGALACSALLIDQAVYSKTDSGDYLTVERWTCGESDLVRLVELTDRARVDPLGEEVSKADLDVIGGKCNSSL